MNIRKVHRRLDRLEESNRVGWRQKRRRHFPSWLAEAFSRLGVADQCVAPAADWAYDALPAQRAFHQNVNARFKGYSGPIGSGKSYALVYEALFLSQLNSGLLGLIGAPTYRMLEDSTQRTFFAVLEAESIPYYFNKQNNRLRFPSNGSEIIFRTMENPERLRGPNLAWFALDELTYTREEAWARLLGRLRHPQARRLCGCAVWTPKGYDWVHQRFLDRRNQDYYLVQAQPKENVHLPYDFYDQLKESYNELFYRQEALGEYLDILGGNAYYAFSEENIESSRYNPELPLCWALDFNVDPMCSVICQIEDQRRYAWSQSPYDSKRILYVLDEIVLSNSNTIQATEAFIERACTLADGPPRIAINIYGDASGNSRSSKSGKTDYELIRECFRRMDIPINLRQNSANPIVRDRVNLMNNALCSASMHRCLFIDPQCTELIKDFRQVRWKRDSAGNPLGELDKSDAQRTHVSDALSYLVVREFGLYAPAGERGVQIL